MNIERIEFLAWMERIMERFNILSEHMHNLQNKRSTIDGEELLDNQDVLQILKILYRFFAIFEIYVLLACIDVLK